MIKKVFKGNVNGKDYDNFTDFSNAVTEALKDNKVISATSSYDKIEVPDKNTKELIPSKDTEIERFTNNLKKFNDRFEKLLDDEHFDPFKIWDSIF